MHPKQRATFGLILLAFLSLTDSTKAHAADVPFDVVIRNGTIVDGSGNPWFLGDVAIKGDRIARVARKINEKGSREIDADGMIVAPGFIDIHSHSDDMLLEDGNAESKIRQGVTLEVLGEGESSGPCAEPRNANVKGQSQSWTTLGGYFEALEKSGISVNVVSYVGLDTIWRGVMGDSFARPTVEQFDAMKRLIDQAMLDGAFGLSSQLAMPPGSLATTEDLVRLCEVVARHKGLYSAHIRNEGADVLASIREIIDVGARAGVPVDIIHVKIADQKNWGKMNEIVKLIDDARARGINVQTNVYPYTRGNNNLASIIPPWAHEGGTAAMLAHLANPSLRDRLKHDIREGISGWYNHYTAIGGDWKRMLVNGKGPYEGMTMDRVIAARSAGIPGADPLDILFEILIEQNGSVPTIYEHHTEKDMNLALIQPWCSIGSDGLAYATDGPLRRGNPHPRSFGTFPRVLGVYSRDRGLLRLEDAVRKMTSLNAAKLGLTDCGLLLAGYHADVVVFDPKTVIDRSTYADPFHYSEGIAHVLVNGVSVIDKGKHTGARPGRAIRRVSYAQAPAPAVGVEKKAEGWTPLFNGKDLTGLYSFLQVHGKNSDPDHVITIANGELHFYKHAKDGDKVVMGYIGTDKEYGDYHLRFEYRWGEKKFAPRYNMKRDAGLYYHVLGEDAVWPRALQFQVEQTNVGDLLALYGFELDTWVDPKTKSEKIPTFLDVDAGGVPRVMGGPGVSNQKHLAGEHERNGWNTAEVIAKADTVTHILNGRVVNRGVNVRLVDPANPGKPRTITKGRIAIELEAAEIFFRNIEIRSIAGN